MISNAAVQAAHRKILLAVDKCKQDAICQIAHQAVTV